MAWIESHDTIWEHHKTIKLCSLLKIGRAQAVGHLHGLWHFVLRNAWRDANLEAWGDAEIERAAWWEGEKLAFTKALRECGFLDGFIVHDWSERAGRLVGDRMYNELRRKSSVKRTLKRRKSLATLPYPTLPNPTLPNLTQPCKESQEKRKVFSRPSLEEVSDYCKERGKGQDPQAFLDYNDARGWMIGKNHIKDWKAVVRTWEKNKFSSVTKTNTQNNQIDEGRKLQEKLMAEEAELKRQDAMRKSIL